MGQGVKQLCRKCIVPQCGAETREGRLLCYAHWKRVPKRARDFLVRCYVKGQEFVSAPPNPGFCVAVATAGLFATYNYTDAESDALLLSLETHISMLEQVGWVSEVVGVDADSDLGRRMLGGEVK